MSSPEDTEKTVENSSYKVGEEYIPDYSRLVMISADDKDNFRCLGAACSVKNDVKLKIISAESDSLKRLADAMSQQDVLKILEKCSDAGMESDIAYWADAALKDSSQDNIVKVARIIYASGCRSLYRKVFELCSSVSSVPEAQFMLGHMFVFDDIEGIEEKDALKYLKNAAAKGNMDAALLLSNMYMYGIIVEQSERSATRYLRSSVHGKNPAALALMGKIHLKHNKRDEAVEYLKESASAGNTEAKDLLKRIEYFEITSKEFNDAIRSANEGNGAAQLAVAKRCMDGYLFDASPEDAKKMLALSAATGNYEARAMLGAFTDGRIDGAKYDSIRSDMEKKKDDLVLAEKYYGYAEKYAAKGDPATASRYLRDAVLLGSDKAVAMLKKMASNGYRQAEIYLRECQENMG